MLYKVNFNHQFFYLICNIFKNKIIFISALDWGLGHATRCVPLIKQLKADNVVIIGITETTSAIFNEEFPELKKVEIEPYNICYSKTLPLLFKLLLDIPRIFGVIKKENQQLDKIIKEYNVDVVISDNRFGLYNKAANCIYITHQLNIQAGIFSVIANKIHHHYIKQFDAVWIPDFENETQSLAGKLSRNSFIKNVRYIGALSRLPFINAVKEEFDYLCLLSGPEPLRSIVEMNLIMKANESHKRICIVRGTTQVLNSFVNKNVKIFNMPNAAMLSELMLGSKTIVCRSGYSTLMDLHHLKKQTVILIPTPGQDEQEYLANYWSFKFGTKVIRQKDMMIFYFD